MYHVNNEHSTLSISEQANGFRIDWEPMFPQLTPHYRKWTTRAEDNN